MPSRPLSPNPSPTRNLFTKTKVLFLALTISSSILIFFSILYFLYHLWHSFSHRSKTIPFDSIAPPKLQRFSYKDLTKASNHFDSSNILGKGGSGTVFRGILKDGKLIAIKRLDSLSLQTEREFQNELQILGGLKSPFLVTLLGYCVEKTKLLLVYEYMPNKSLQESLFSDGFSNLCWEKRFEIILDVSRALEFLHNDCDPPVIHGDIKPSNVLLDTEFRAKISDFGLSRIKEEGDCGVDLFQDIWKSQELSGNFAAETPPQGSTTPVESASTEVDFALALQASSSSKNSRMCYNVKALNLNSSNYNDNILNVEIDVKSGSEKGKEISTSDQNGDDWHNNHRFVPYEDENCSFENSNESNCNASLSVHDAKDTIQWGKDWWWKQDGSGELCSKDYVTEWIGSQICPTTNPDSDEEEKSVPEKNDCNSSSAIENSDMGKETNLQGFPGNKFENKELEGKRNCKKKQKKMVEWWKEEHLAEIAKKSNGSIKIKNLKSKWKKGTKIPHFNLGKRFYFCRKGNPNEQVQNEHNHRNGDFSFRRGWKKKSTRSTTSDMCSGDLFSHELSSTTSMRGTLCYVAPEYNGCGFFMEKADIYSLGVLILVVVSGRRPLHVLASPMKLEKANLISWCKQLAQNGNVLELVDERLKDDYNNEQACLCINLALSCLHKMPELRPEIGEIVKVLKGEMDFPSIAFEFSPSPPSKLYSSSSRRKQKSTVE